MGGIGAGESYSSAIDDLVTKVGWEADVPVNDIKLDELYNRIEAVVLEWLDEVENE